MPDKGKELEIYLSQVSELTRLTVVERAESGAVASLETLTDELTELVGALNGYVHKGIPNVDVLTGLLLSMGAVLAIIMLSQTQITEEPDYGLD